MFIYIMLMIRVCTKCFYVFYFNLVVNEKFPVVNNVKNNSLLTYLLTYLLHGAEYFLSS